MARLAALPLRSLMFGWCSSVRILAEARAYFLVTSFAGFCADVLSGINGSLTVAGFSRLALLRN